MQIQENISLKKYNTFGIDVKARKFAAVESTEQLQEIIHSGLGANAFVLGGGSNVLFTGYVDRLVIRNGIKGIEKIAEDEEYIHVRTGAGENWHDFVMHCIENNWAGIENLSLIPGNVGASPMQNIGAYGVEISEVFYQLEAYHLSDHAMVTFRSEDCAFGYRDSIFKSKYKDQFVIVYVTYKLRKQPRFNTSYGTLEAELQKMGVQELSLKTISQAVINIRSSKLPDPRQIGNAGSFFKNPSIFSSRFQDLQSRFPSIIGYPIDNAQVKLAAGWLIEQCGWKGYRIGDAGCHVSQALVLVNYGHATGKDIFQLSEDILQSVKTKFGVELEREVNII